MQRELGSCVASSRDVGCPKVVPGAELRPDFDRLRRQHFSHRSQFVEPGAQLRPKGHWLNLAVFGQLGQVRPMADFARVAASSSKLWPKLEQTFGRAEGRSLSESPHLGEHTVRPLGPNGEHPADKNSGPTAVRIPDMCWRI